MYGCVYVVVVVIGRSHAAGPRVVGGSPARHRAPDDKRRFVGVVGVVRGRDLRAVRRSRQRG